MENIIFSLPKYYLFSPYARIEFIYTFRPCFCVERTPYKTLISKSIKSEMKYLSESILFKIRGIPFWIFCLKVNRPLAPQARKL